MINFHYESEFVISNEKKYSDWISRIIKFHKGLEGDINYIFCDDVYLLKINNEYLNHDTFTDIITFDNSIGNEIATDVFISSERIEENALIFEVGFDDELKRVMSHGLLHLLGFNDKSEDDKDVMREEENRMIKLFHVEHS